jgi:hypothetical protein
MKFRPNGWQRIGIIISILWILFIVGCWANSYANMQDFDSLTYQSFPPFDQSFNCWVYSNNNKIISIYRSGDNGLTPKDAFERSAQLRVDHQNGLINPLLKIKYDQIIISIIFPIFLFWFFSYLTVWITRWIAAGFRIKNVDKN